MSDAFEEATELIAGLVAQGCHTEEDGVIDSMAISVYAEALHWLADRGLVQIEHEHGRRVLARWIEKEPT